MGLPRVLVAALGEPCPRGMREDMRQRLVRLGANAKDLVIGNALSFTEMQGSTGECVETALDQAAQQGLVLALGQGLVTAALDLGQRKLR